MPLFLLMVGEADTAVNATSPSAMVVFILKYFGRVFVSGQGEAEAGMLIVDC